ncbi:MAG: hypothetical protein ACI4MF_12700 [Candidatus Faecivicinus sp.]
MKFEINFPAMVATIPDAMIGWAGVFAVTLVIIACVWVLNKVTVKRDK